MTTQEIISHLRPLSRGNQTSTIASWPPGLAATVLADLPNDGDDLFYILKDRRSEDSPLPAKDLV